MAGNAIKLRAAFGGINLDGSLVELRRQRQLPITELVFRGSIRLIIEIYLASPGFAVRLLVGQLDLQREIARFSKHLIRAGECSVKIVEATELPGANFEDANVDSQHTRVWSKTRGQPSHLPLPRVVSA